MNEHEYYVSPELLKLLKEAGFDWEIFDGYITYENGYGFTTRLQNPHNFNGDNGDLFINYRGYKEVFSRPTLDVAQRWLREVKQCYVHVYPMFSFEGTLEYYFVEVIYPRSRNIKPNVFNTYEEALEAGEKKALEIILEKGGQHDS